MADIRSAAVSCLINILEKGGKPKHAVEGLSVSFDERDRSFLMEVVYGATRYRDSLDWVLGHFLDRPGNLPAFTRNNLRAAVYQIFLMRVPDWAAVNEAVEAEKRKAGGRPSLVNGVLRNVIRQRKKVSLPAEIGDPAEKIAVNTSHPLWMVRRWIERFGIVDAEALAAANNVVAPLVLRTNTLRTNRDGLLGLLSSKGVEAGPTGYSPEGIILESVRSFDALSFASGLCVVQDEASQLISHLLSPRPGQRVLDACAAPGGKTTHIAQLMGNEGEVVAVEQDETRIARMRENIGRLGVSSVRVVHAEIGDFRDDAGFDRVLVDAPCSASGIIRKAPDVKYRLTEEGLRTSAAKQADILRAASRLLRPGGILVYAVCSVEPEEGEDLIEDFLKTDKEFRIIDADALFLKDFISGGLFRTYPHKHAMDGFFGVRLCRRA